jgi:hypothetical protein
MAQFGDQLRDKYGVDIDEDGFVRGVYHGELQRFAHGIHGRLKAVDERAYLSEEVRFLAAKLDDRAAHLRSCLVHASRAQGRQVVIFLDNVDQRDFEFQEQVFLMAQSLAETWPGTVFVSLRPETFHQSRVAGSLAAYQPRVFTIAPPRVDLVLNRRLAFTKKQLDAQGRLNSFPEGLTVQTVSLSKYMQVLIESFERMGEVVEFVDNLSAGNVRVALGFLESFVGSGHVDTSKILEIFDQTGHYFVPLHEFMRAVIYQDNEYYNPSASPVVNLFDITTSDPREHFLLPIILAFIAKAGEVGGIEGFVALDRVLQFTQALGFHPTQLRVAVDRAATKRLIERSPRFGEDVSGSRCRITTIGAYSFKRLVSNFTYIDAIVVDTPIIGQSWRAQISDARSISNRLARAEVFRAYLDRQWFGLAGKDVVFDWPAASHDLYEQTTRIGRLVDPENWP